MTYNIALLRGDGIGPEIVDSACRVLCKVGEIYGHEFNFTPYLMGGCAIDATGCPLPQETIDGCLASDSVLLGAVGGPKWDTLPGSQRPEKGLLGIRAAMGLYTNIRPAKLYPALATESPLRADITAKGFDLAMFRELIGGIYFGERGRSEDGQTAYDTEKYSVYEIERIAHAAFKAARLRRGKVTSIDKANVLESSRLWRETVHKVAAEYPDVICEDMLVDNAAMQLVKNPAQFDVIVTSNIFGDILSDEASQITGSIGLLPSASIGDSTRGLYEPIHGSAPDIAGTGKANPIATILSAAMMLRYAFSLETEARSIEAAVDSVLAAGYRTADILGASDATPLTCTEMTDRIIEALA
ncbi:MAG: 3-isopropylmalate dehydrogenase [Clostridia bacterium]|nr:3-isopropylmalate dehydrogenase [Clostridia bacterium]